MRLSRLSGKMPSQMTSVMSPVARSAKSIAVVRSAAIVPSICAGLSHTYPLALRIGHSMDGEARNAHTQTISCTCGSPGGIMSLSKRRPKNIR